MTEIDIWTHCRCERFEHIEGDSLELACDNLILEKINRVFNRADADIVTKACAFAKELGCGIDSEAFRTAELLVDQDADAITVAGAMLAPLLWQGLVNLDEIRQRCGQKVSATLEDLGPPAILHLDTERYRRQDVHNFLASLAGTPRKALILISFRLLALERAIARNEPHSRQMAQETLDLYVPIANRLSLGELRRRLEDACFHILDAAGYRRLRQEVAPIQAEDDRCLKILMEGVRRLLANNRIQGRVQGRTKSLYGIRRKMNRTGKTLAEIMDRIGVRVIVQSVPECYTVLGLLHSHFKPIPGTFDDYIGLPKDNGYQSLHTCVYPVREISHKPIEFQVRTELMHMEAEHGTAAHWRYKGEIASATTDRNRERWMRGLVRQHDKAASAEAFIELLHRQVFSGQLVVFGKGGHIVRLAEKATVRDYLATSNIHVSRGAVVKVNGRTVSLDRVLRDGDSIEIVAGDERVPSRPERDGSAKSSHGIGAQAPFGTVVGNQVLPKGKATCNPPLQES